MHLSIELGTASLPGCRQVEHLRDVQVPSFLLWTLSFLLFQQNNGDLTCDLRLNLSESTYLLSLDAPETVPFHTFDDSGSGLELLSTQLDSHIRMRDQVVIPTGIG